MVDSTVRSIVIAAPAKQVMAVIADFDQYPSWVAAAKSVDVIERDAASRARLVRFVLDAGIFQESYDLAYRWSGDGRSVSWDLVRGDLQKEQHGSYTLVDQPCGSTEVTYELSVDLNIPMIGAFKRKAERVITDTALKELKKRVEG